MFFFPSSFPNLELSSQSKASCGTTLPRLFRTKHGGASSTARATGEIQFCTLPKGSQDLTAQHGPATTAPRLGVGRGKVDVTLPKGYFCETADPGSLDQRRCRSHILEADFCTEPLKWTKEMPSPRVSSQAVLDSGVAKYHAPTANTHGKMVGTEQSSILRYSYLHTFHDSAERSTILLDLPRCYHTVHDAVEPSKFPLFVPSTILLYLRKCYHAFHDTTVLVTYTVPSIIPPYLPRYCCTFNDTAFTIPRHLYLLKKWHIPRYS